MKQRRPDGQTDTLSLRRVSETDCKKIAQHSDMHASKLVADFHGVRIQLVGFTQFHRRTDGQLACAFKVKAQQNLILLHIPEDQTDQADVQTFRKAVTDHLPHYTITTTEDICRELAPGS